MKEGNAHKVVYRNKSDNPNVLIFITDPLFKNFIADPNNFSEKLQSFYLTKKHLSNNEVLIQIISIIIRLIL